MSACGSNVIVVVTVPPPPLGLPKRISRGSFFMFGSTANRVRRAPVSGWGHGRSFNMTAVPAVTSHYDAGVLTGLRGGCTRGDSRVRPSYVPDVSGEGASLQAVSPLVGEWFSFKVNLPLCSGVLSRYPRWKPGGRYSAHTRTDRWVFSRAKYDEIYV